LRRTFVALCDGQTKHRRRPSRPTSCRGIFRAVSSKTTKRPREKAPVSEWPQVYAFPINPGGPVLLRPATVRPRQQPSPSSGPPAGRPTTPVESVQATANSTHRGPRPKSKPILVGRGQTRVSPNINRPFLSSISSVIRLPPRKKRQPTAPEPGLRRGWKGSILVFSATSVMGPGGHERPSRWGRRESANHYPAPIAPLFSPAPPPPLQNKTTRWCKNGGKKVVFAIFQQQAVCPQLSGLWISFHTSVKLSEQAAHRGMTCGSAFAAVFRPFGAAPAGREMKAGEPLPIIDSGNHNHGIAKFFCAPPRRLQLFLRGEHR